MGFALETPTAPALDAATFRAALGRFATGVAFVTAAPGGEPAGLVVNSLASVSLEPPLVSFCPSRSSLTWCRMRQARHFGVSVLARSHEAFARRASPAGRRPLRRRRVDAGHTGVPLLGDASLARARRRAPGGRSLDRRSLWSTKCTFSRSSPSRSSSSRGVRHLCDEALTRRSGNEEDRSHETLRDGRGGRRRRVPSRVSGGDRGRARLRESDGDGERRSSRPTRSLWCTRGPSPASGRLPRAHRPPERWAGGPPRTEGVGGGEYDDTRRRRRPPPPWSRPAPCSTSGPRADSRHPTGTSDVDAPNLLPLGRRGRGGAQALAQESGREGRAVGPVRQHHPAGGKAADCCGAGALRGRGPPLTCFRTGRSPSEPWRPWPSA